MSITKYNQFLQVCPPAVSLPTLGRNEVTSSRPTSFFKTFFFNFIYQPVSPSSFLPVPSLFRSTPSLSTPPPCCAVSPPLSSVQRHLSHCSLHLSQMLFSHCSCAVPFPHKGMKYLSPILLKFSVYSRLLVLTSPPECHARSILML